MELQTVRMLRKKRCCKRFFFALIGKDIYYLNLVWVFVQMSVSGERDHWKESSKYLETWEVTWNGKTTCKLVLKDLFLKSRPLGKKESRKDKLAKSKRAKIGSFIRWLFCQLSLGSVNLLAAASRFLIQFWSEIKERMLADPQRVTPFSLANDTAWSTVGVTLFPSRERDWNIQHSNLPTQTIELIVEEHHVFHGALHWLGSHIPQLWPATLEVKLSTLSLG